jgi:phage shock protein C
VTGPPDATATRPRPRLCRSRRDRLLAGVCGGLAEWLGWPPLAVRLLFIAVSVLPLVPGILIYAVLWLLLPQAEEPA